MYDVAIIGAGVVGGMIARTLSAYWKRKMMWGARQCNGQRCRIKNKL